MIDTLATIINIRIAMKTNSKINALRNIPIIKKIIPQSLYKSSGLKGIFVALAWISEFFRIFIWKILYYGIVGVMAGIIAMDFIGGDAGKVCVHFLIFFPVIGMAINNNSFTVDEDTYCSVFVLRMDAKKYMLSQYLLDTLDYVLGTLVVAGVALCLVMKQPFYVLLCYVVYATSIKWIFTGRLIKFREKRIGDPKADSVILSYKVLFVMAPLFAAFIALFLFKCVLPGKILVILAVVTFMTAILSCRYMFSYREYRRIYKNVVRPDVIVETEQTLKTIDFQAAKDGLELDSADVENVGAGNVFSSSKDGYAFFNEMFMKRHKKLLIKPAKMLSIVLIAVFVLLVILCLINDKLRDGIRMVLLNRMPIMLLVMYLINSGKTTTEAMFVNCDNAMLNYRFYRQPKALVRLFADRLKYIIYFNIIPAFVTACGLEVLLVVSGGSENVADYIVIFVSVIIMSVFFSTHNMVLYYLFQPYAADSTMKSPIYKTIHFMTYMVCYVSMDQLKVTTTEFCSVIIAFSVIYIVVALLLVYRIAPKTFRLR